MVVNRLFQILFIFDLFWSKVLILLAFSTFFGLSVIGYFIYTPLQAKNTFFKVISFNFTKVNIILFGKLAD